MLRNLEVLDRRHLAMRRNKDMGCCDGRWKVKSEKWKVGACWWDCMWPETLLMDGLWPDFNFIAIWWWKEVSISLGARRWVTEESCFKALSAELLGVC
jgi:hypothetical protein